MTDDLPNPHYKGNRIPIVLKLVWTIGLIYFAYYLYRNAWPDLQQWLK